VQNVLQFDRTFSVVALKAVRGINGTSATVSEDCRKRLREIMIFSVVSGGHSDGAGVAVAIRNSLRLIA
jgi:hypothetical protein